MNQAAEDKEKTRSGDALGAKEIVEVNSSWSTEDSSRNSNAFSRALNCTVDEVLPLVVDYLIADNQHDELLEQSAKHAI